MEEPQSQGRTEQFQMDPKDGDAVDEAELPPEFLIKHPLQNSWTLWYFDPVKGNSNWKDQQKEIVSFDTIEDFWSVYNHTKLASELKLGSDYSLFKRGIEPMWEDPRNERGGRWMLAIDRKSKIVDLDRIWLEVCLSLIGESFENADEVCGAVIAIRPKQYKISMWTADLTKQSAIMEIGSKLKDRLKLPKGNLIYQSHEDAATKAGSTIKKIFSL